MLWDDQRGRGRGCFGSGGLAQLFSGVCLTARAVGSAVAVRLVPIFGTAGAFAGFAGLSAVAGFVLASLLVRDWPSRAIQGLPNPVDA